MDPQAAREDFVSRMRNYEETYEEVEEGNFIKVFNAGETLITHNIRGYIPSQIAFYLMNSHLNSRVIFLSSHGKTISDTKERFSVSGALSHDGKIFSEKLAEYFLQQNLKDLTVWTGTSEEVTESSKQLKRHFLIQRRKDLDDQNYGLFSDRTIEDIKKQLPAEYNSFRRDRMAYRYVFIFLRQDESLLGRENETRHSIVLSD
jgi:hypothetical protein